MKLKPYMVSDGEPEEAAALVFHFSKRQAESLAYPVIKGWYDQTMRADIVGKRLEARPDIMDQAASDEPHVIESPRGCPNCEMWGGEPRFDGLCEFCEDDDVVAPEEPMKAKLRMPDKYAGMNGVEKEWALQLESVQRTGEGLPWWDHSVVKWRFEPLTFRLAKATTYRPDFMVLRADGQIELHEIKQVRKKHQSGRSGWMSASAVKFKTCAELYPEFVWVACEKQLDGTWKTTPAEDLFKRTKT